MMCCNSHPSSLGAGAGAGPGWWDLAGDPSTGSSVVLSGDCGVAAGRDEPQPSRCSPSCEESGTGMGDAVLGRGGRAVQLLVMLWKRGA